MLQGSRCIFPLFESNRSRSAIGEIRTNEDSPARFLASRVTPIPTNLLLAHIAMAEVLMSRQLEEALEALSTLLQLVSTGVGFRGSKTTCVVNPSRC